MNFDNLPRQVFLEALWMENNINWVPLETSFEMYMEEDWDWSFDMTDYNSSSFT